MPSPVGAREGVAVRDVVRAVLAEVASEELPVFDGLAVFDDEAVVRKLRGHGRREPLGFGWNDVETLVTPVVWLAIDQAARQFGKSAADGAKRGVNALARKVFRRHSAQATVPPLTPYQLADVRAQVLKAALDRGLRRNRAEDIANAVYAELSFDPTRQKSEVDSPAEHGSED